MAIEKQLERGQSPINFPLNNAYIKVNDVQIRLNGKTPIRIDVSTYADIQSRQEENSQTVDKKSFNISFSEFIEKGNPTAFTIPEIKAAAYRYLKAIGITGKDV